MSNGLNLFTMKIRAVSIILVLLLLLGSTTVGLEGDLGPYEEQNIRSDYPFDENYPSVDELYGWYIELETNYPHIVTRHHIGHSWEGRNLWVLEITGSNTQVEKKPSILIDGGMHAREWSSIQVASYLTWRLIDGYDSNDTIHWLINNRRIFVMPVLNPDGYIYDGDGDISRRQNWRKNRNDSIPGDNIGVDLNRNWDIYWREGSDYPHRDDYRGEKPFSENETLALKEFIIENDIQSYQNLHSYWGTLLIPWGFANLPTPHEDWYRAVAEHMTSFTTKRGDEDRTYSYGRAEKEIGYSAPGGATDWVYENTGAHSFLFEIYTGAEGFYPREALIMEINQDLDDSLIYQCRIADTDLGDGNQDLYPPVPYIVYGNVWDEDEKDPWFSEVKIKNQHTGESLYIDTDTNGYYELNLGNLLKHGYEKDDTFTISVDETMLNFTIDDNWGRRIDLTTSDLYTPPEVKNIEVFEKDGSIELYWDINERRIFTDIGFNVYRDGKVIAHTQNYHYQDTQVERGETYTYFITAVSEGGEGPRSESVEISIDDYLLSEEMRYLVLGITGVMVVIVLIYLKKVSNDD